MPPEGNSVLVEEGDTMQAWYPTLDEAVQEAEKQIAAWKDPEGWCEQVEEVCVMQMTHQAAGDYGKGFTLQETEAGKLLRLAPAVIEAAKRAVEFWRGGEHVPMASLCEAIEAFEAATSEGTDAQ